MSTSARCIGRTPTGRSLRGDVNRGCRRMARLTQMRRKRCAKRSRDGGGCEGAGSEEQRAGSAEQGEESGEWGVESEERA